MTLDRQTTGVLTPSAARAAAFDRRMRQRLGDSLRYLLSEAAGALGVEASALDDFFPQLPMAPVSPLTFGAYFELVPAIERADLSGSMQLLREIAECHRHAGGTGITAFEQAEPTARYARLLNVDPATPFELLPPSHESAKTCRRLIDEAFTLMDRCDLALAQEIRCLVREIVIACGSTSRSGLVFDGASSFMFWGAIVLNAERHTTVLDMIQALAHESGHTLLFGLCADTPLVNDDDVARYPSPLRRDRRPMDGIVHATLVSARMHRAVARLLAADAFAKTAIEAARLALAEHRRNFEDGVLVVDRHARLTHVGGLAMDDARRYMAEARC